MQSALVLRITDSAAGVLVGEGGVGSKRRFWGGQSPAMVTEALAGDRDAITTIVVVVVSGID